MVEALHSSSALSDAEIDTKAKQIFNGIFEEIFLSNGKQPLSREQIQAAFQMKLGDSYDDKLDEEVQTFFYGADENNVSVMKSSTLFFLAKCFVGISGWLS